MARHAALAAEIDHNLKNLEDQRVCDYRPAFLTAPGRPARVVIRGWVSGFWRAMALDPEGWGTLAEDERTRAVIIPFVGFLDPEKTKHSNRPTISMRALTKASPIFREPSSFCIKLPSYGQPENLKPSPPSPAARSDGTIRAPVDQVKNTSAAVPKAEPATAKSVGKALGLPCNYSIEVAQTRRQFRVPSHLRVAALSPLHPIKRPPHRLLP
jgi:hypothetical protein